MRFHLERDLLLEQRISSSILHCPNKVAATLNAERPKTKKQVRLFLGLMGFYKSIIPKFAGLAAPLTQLKTDIEKNQTKWGKSQGDTFQQLRKVLTVQSLSRKWPICINFIIQVDASEIGLGAV